MAVTAADLTLRTPVSPDGTGELDPAWWAEGALAVLLPVWLAAGVAVVPEDATAEQGDAVVTAYAYGTAYDAKLLAMASSPNSLSIDSGDISLSYTDGQRKIFQTRAAYWWDKYTAALDATGTFPATVDNPPRASYSQEILVRF